VNNRTHIAIISDEPTPYRLHVLGRIARELPQVALHSLFTHPVPSMPWKLGLEEDIRPVVFPGLSLNNRSIVSPYSLPLFFRIRDYLVAQRIRLVVLLGYNNLTRFLLIHWAHSKGIPLLLTGDSNVFDDSRHGYLFRGMKRLYIGHVVNRVSALMPMGTCGRAYYRSYADHNKPTFLFPYEPDYAKLQTSNAPAKEAFLRGHDLSPARHRLLYCGRLIGVKRVDVLLDAFVRILDHRPDWDLVIAGDGPLRKQLQRRLPANARDRVRWLGFLQLDELIACYHSCHALVLPSEREPWALVINEAVATGLPVVSSEVVGAAVELVRHGVNGLLVPPRNVHVMTNALLEITEPRRNEEFRRAAPAVLDQWRTAADPVAGLRQALKYFNLIM
jgi:glycosyltransferase involved in cell wall biosynthesis